jgi:hypothetical protein
MDKPTRCVVLRSMSLKAPCKQPSSCKIDLGGGIVSDIKAQDIICQMTASSIFLALLLTFSFFHERFLQSTCLFGYICLDIVAPTATALQLNSRCRQTYES